MKLDVDYQRDYSQYGLTHDGKLTDTLLNTIYKYVRLRILPFNELAYYETYDYGIRRSDLHSSIADSLDLDRELVEKAFAKAASKYHAKMIRGIVVDGSIPNWEKDFDKIHDDFCIFLKEYAKLESQERHPNKLTEEELDEISKDLSDLKSPDELMN